MTFICDLVKEIKTGYKDQRNYVKRAIDTRDRPYLQTEPFRCKIPENHSKLYKVGIKLYSITHLEKTMAASLSIITNSLEYLQETGVESCAEVPEQVKKDLKDLLKRMK